MQIEIARASADPRSVARPERGPRRSGRGSRRAVAPGAAAAAHRASSPPVALLALQVLDSGALGESRCCARPSRRPSIAARSSTSSFKSRAKSPPACCPVAHRLRVSLFRRPRSEQSASELRGGLTPPPLTMTAEGGGAMQLAAQRIALNLHEAGFNVQVASTRARTAPTLSLRRLPLA